MCGGATVATVGRMDITQLVKATAASLGATMEEEDKVFFLTVAVEADDDEADENEEPPNQVVMLYADEDGETLIASADAGPCSDESDLGAVLRGLASVVYSRVYLGEPDEDGEHLFVEAGIPLKGLDAETLAPVVQEVAEISDWLDELLFEEEAAGE